MTATQADRYTGTFVLVAVLHTSGFLKNGIPGILEFKFLWNFFLISTHAWNIRKTQYQYQMLIILYHDSMRAPSGRARVGIPSIPGIAVLMLYFINQQNVHFVFHFVF